MKVAIVAIISFLVLIFISSSCTNQTSPQVSTSETTLTSTSETPQISKSTTANITYPIGARYIDVSNCSELAQFAIQAKGIPVDMINSCSGDNLLLDTGEFVNIVRINYGPLMGDLYSHYIGVFTDNNQNLVDLPDIDIYGAMWGRPPLNKLKMRVLHSEGQNQYNQSVALRNGYYGWVLKIKYSFSTEHYNEEEARIIKTFYYFSGEIFVYLDESGVETWDESHLYIEEKEIT